MTAPEAGVGRLQRLIALVIERLRVTDDVAAAKFVTGSPIDDPEREEQLLGRVRAQAESTGLDPDAAREFVRDQILASKAVQRGLFERWSTRPESAPAARPDLGVIRDRLDSLTAALLREFGAVSATVDAHAGHSASAAFPETAALDELHRRGLVIATRHVR